MVTKAAIKAVMSEFGKRGGSVKSEKKARAVRRNGKLGGRPKKSTEKAARVAK